METVVFVTGNSFKFSVAKEALKGSGINLIQKDIKPPEIQSTSVSEIASASAVWSSSQLNESVIVTDVGYYIKALNGFPGPFIKWVNGWLTKYDFEKLMENKTDRTIEVREALAFCRPNGSPQVFIDTITATLALKAGMDGLTPINSLYIPNGFDKVETEISHETMIEYWSKNSTKWQQFITFYKTSI